MSITLLANENFPAPAIRKLRAAGVDVVAARVVISERNIRRKHFPAGG